jgi:hypothetical protein
MPASANKAASACDELPSYFHSEAAHVALFRILLIGAIASMTLVHAMVLYKIDAGVRSSDATTVLASPSRRAYW